MGNKKNAGRKACEKYSIIYQGIDRAGEETGAGTQPGDIGRAQRQENTRNLAKSLGLMEDTAAPIDNPEPLGGS